MIRFSNVSKRYPGGFEALSDVSLHLAPGEMAFLTGHSGAGKSTLLKLIALIERPTNGQVIINGQNFAKVGGGASPTCGATSASSFRTIACCSIARCSTMSPCR